MSSFDKIAGYERQKAELAELVEIFNNRKKYELKGATLPKGVIFYGEAGTGKTLFSEIMAKECGLNKISISLSEAASQNNICRQIKKAFIKGARSRTPTMIFFDELDKLLPNQEEEYCPDRAKSILTELLTLIDGMDKINNIVFVATCNDYYSLPSSLTRAGRFDKKIYLGLPDQASRTAILKMYMDNSPAEFSMKAESIAKLCGGFSCAALKTLVNECLLHSTKDNYVSEELIKNKILEIKEEDIPTERSMQSYTIDAVRNIGAFIVSRTYSNSDYILTVDDGTVCNAFLDRILPHAYSECYDEDYDDDEESEKEEPGSVYSKSDYLAAITALLGGYAAEEIIFNKIYDNLGQSIRFVDTILLRMSERGLLGLDMCFIERSYESLEYPETYIEKLHQVFLATVDDCYKKARALIEKNEDIINKLVAVLIKQKSIEKAECEEILAELGGLSL